MSTNTKLIADLRKMSRLRPIGARDIYTEAADALEATERDRQMSMSMVAALEAVIAKAIEEGVGPKREPSVVFRIDAVLDTLEEAPRAALDAVIADAKAEQRETDGDVTRLADMIHRAMDYQYDECQHGTYSGGVSHGEPYRMCEIFARRVSAELRKAAE